jgi:hypothetical protein
MFQIDMRARLDRVEPAKGNVLLVEQAETDQEKHRNLTHQLPHPPDIHEHDGPLISEEHLKCIRGSRK